jgi:membrane protease subunit HflK
MADPTDPKPTAPDSESYPSEAIEPMEAEAPRRAASAEFVVDAGVGSDAVLREAMDPANQSLADALRLSFRILQIVILVLVVLFLASGFRTVDENQSGVLTVWGRIAPVAGHDALDPGPHWSRWPYPIGEFIVFPVEGLQVSIAEAFWPDVPPGMTSETMVTRAGTGDQLRPGRDGSLITRDGGLAHLKMTATYEIDDPREFIEQLPSVAEAARLVRLTLQSAAVQVVGALTVQEVVESGPEVRAEIETRAQRTIDQMKCGIRLVSVSLPEPPLPPFAIQNAFGDLQQAKVAADRNVEKARLTANELLIDAAGENYREIAALIDQYEKAFDRKDVDEEARLLTQINDWLESDEASGVVSDTIKRSRAYVSEVESTVGNEARHFQALLPTFRDHPELVVSQLWTEAYGKVLSQPDCETFVVPPGKGLFGLKLFGLDAVQDVRRQMLLDRLEATTNASFADKFRPYIPRVSEVDERLRLRVRDGQVKSAREAREGE